ncbi:hypothetical protein SAMN05192563_104352 [Paraburkholderia aspalathi]|uniref:Uncharacterized protein n=1 Tax=Paraburkholderia aspalathi TaxID=1324617 RepID=A0A1I7EPV4_9BURK|nr:hypothetical protein SAMN05192563_104352 [Paraburkholderia aspalathi]
MFVSYCKIDRMAPEYTNKVPQSREFFDAKQPPI